ncbi:MAG: RsmD family RNA methyltransferase [Candidatus Micrarchaeota archaeon]|nr:RsmD family RNA methyltransferase [Candidatus Micrarchaeota archaeon]
MTLLLNTTIREGSASLLIPKQCLIDPHHCEVFYNSAMQFNRSISALFLAACLEITNITKPLLFDGFCGVGARGVRYLKESGVAKVIFCDANNKTVPFIKKNIAANKVQKKTKILNMDVNQALANSPVFDVIELDPFGSPLQCLDSAFRRGKKQFILSLTFTDLANLCGGHKAACKRYYEASSMNCAFCHELAMRIILARVAKIGAFHEYGVTPLVSWYEGHYVKIFLQCEKSCEKADENFKQIGYAWLCTKCTNRGLSAEKIIHCSCGNETKTAGPLWVGKYSQKEIIQKTLQNLQNLNSTNSKFYSEKQRGELENFLLLLRNESETPLFFSLPELCSRLKVSTPKLASFIEKIKQSGFEASATHFSPDCFKTNASISQLSALL